MEFPVTALSALTACVGKCIHINAARVLLWYEEPLEHSSGKALRIYVRKIQAPCSREDIPPRHHAHVASIVAEVQVVIYRDDIAHHENKFWLQEQQTWEDLVT